MAEREFIVRITKEALSLTKRLDQAVIDLLKIMDRIKSLDNSDELDLLFLKNNFEKYATQIEILQKEIKRIRHLFSIYSEEMLVSDKVIWEDYYRIEYKFQATVKEFMSFTEEYKYFVPNNASELQQKVRDILTKKDFIIDGAFEGDYATWIGVYARPKDKPTYLDPSNEEEALLQEKYSVSGFKQDFSEWFEWEIQKGKLLDK